MTSISVAAERHRVISSSMDSLMTSLTNIVGRRYRTWSHLMENLEIQFAVGRLNNRISYRRRLSTNHDSGMATGLKSHRSLFFPSSHHHTTSIMFPSLRAPPQSIDWLIKSSRHYSTHGSLPLLQSCSCSCSCSCSHPRSDNAEIAATHFLYTAAYHPPENIIRRVYTDLPKVSNARVIILS